MSVGYAILTSIVICALASALEAAFVGKNVKAFFSTLKFPRYSAPLWASSMIAGGYYVIFGYVVYRLLTLDSDSAIWYVAFTLVMFIMAVNALADYIVFRAQNLRLSFIVGALFAVIDMALFVCLIKLDKDAAWALILYLPYRIYAVWWVYALWKTNRVV